MRVSSAVGSAFRLVGVFAGVVLLAPAALALDGETLIRQGAATNLTIDAASSGLPIKLNRAGHYKLTTNINVPSMGRPNAPRCGIEIAEVNVTLDLNGFALIGENMSASVGVCLRANSATIVNGTISGFGNAITGIDNTDLAPGGASYVRIENVRPGRNALHIRLGGKANLVKSNTLSDGGLLGIDCAAGCAVIGNLVMDGEFSGASAGIVMHSGVAIGNVVAGYKSGLVCNNPGTCGFSQNSFFRNGTDVVGAAARPMNPNSP